MNGKYLGSQNTHKTPVGQNRFVEADFGGFVDDFFLAIVTLRGLSLCLWRSPDIPIIHRTRPIHLSIFIQLFYFFVDQITFTHYCDSPTILKLTCCNFTGIIQFTTY